MIAVSITSNTLEDALKDIQIAKNSGANLAELRIDYMDKPDLKKLISASVLPVIVTNRCKEEGGYFNGSEEQRIAYLMAAARLHAAYIDIELKHMPGEFDKNSSKLIVSYHNFSETPQNLKEIYNQIANTDADIVKIATMAKTKSDAGRMIGLIEYAPKPIIGICMGELGKITRQHPKNYLTFKCLPGKASAPGQLTINEL
jgi:3-dehydroquinate dehydratase/shikimate dehydrogenase